MLPPWTFLARRQTSAVSPERDPSGDALNAARSGSHSPRYSRTPWVMARRCAASGSGTLQLRPATADRERCRHTRVLRTGAWDFHRKSSKISFILISFVAGPKKVRGSIKNDRTDYFFPFFFPPMMFEKNPPLTVIFPFQFRDLCIEFFLLIADRTGGDNLNPDEKIAGFSAPLACCLKGF